jgi:hypothetical protein
MTALILLSASGCGSSGSKSNEKTTAAKKPAVTDKAEKDTAEETQTDTVPEEDPDDGGNTTVLGAGLENTRQLFSGDYTYNVVTTFSDTPDEETSAVMKKQGDKVYITYTDKGSKKPDRAYYYDGTTAYDIDFGLKIYSSREVWNDYNLILSLINSEPENTEAHPSDDEDGFTTEQYTYPGDTYMTVFDFRFDKDNTLVDYTVTYTVEGQDDIVQSCKVNSLKEKAEIAGDPLEGLNDFGSMTEDQRLGFCQGICGERGISTDNMYEMNITTDDLKRIDYETFTTLVYTYGK